MIFIIIIILTVANKIDYIITYSSIDSTSMLVANLKPLYILGTMATLVAGFTPINYHHDKKYITTWP